MPIIIPKDIPAYSVLGKEKVFVLTEKRAVTQDIRPIEIAILNLMPIKWETETQLMRLLSNSPLQVNVTLVSTETYESKHTAPAHMKKFYKPFSKICEKKFDGMIITGAPVETLPFEDVQYWKELTTIMDFAKKNVTSTMFICWGAQAALYYHFGIHKHLLDKKMFGIFAHTRCVEYDPLLKGFDDVFYIPHSRHTGVNDEEVFAHKKLQVLAASEDAGVGIIKSKDNRMVFLTGHSEYDKFSLKAEYDRDVSKGLPIDVPKNYFINGTEEVDVRWKSTANLLFSNWLNYYVYQVTPYDIEMV